MKLQTESPICDKNNIRKKEKTRNTIDFFFFIFPQQPTKYIILQFLPSSALISVYYQPETTRSSLKTTNLAY